MVRGAFPGPGGEVDAEDVLNDDAWPALRSLLCRLEDAGLEPVGLLRKRAAEREFVSDPHDPARSAAKILHYRLGRDLSYGQPSPNRPENLPGWISSPVTIDPDETDPDRRELVDWLLHRAHRIADRVCDLGEQAAHHPPVWVGDLGEVPADAVARDVWILCAGHVAAYRERWRVPDTDPTMLPPCDRGEQGRARRWVADYLAHHLLPQPATELPRVS